MKFLASDYDGTLRLAPQVDPATAARVAQFQSHGHRFGIVTGRALNTIYDEAHHNQVDPDVFICSNGALIADRDQNILTAHWIPFDRACALIEYLKQSGTSNRSHSAMARTAVIMSMSTSCRVRAR